MDVQVGEAGGVSKTNIQWRYMSQWCHKVAFLQEEDKGSTRPETSEVLWCSMLTAGVVDDDSRIFSMIKMNVYM